MAILQDAGGSETIATTVAPQPPLAPTPTAPTVAPTAQLAPILQPGQAYIDTGDVTSPGPIIVAPTVIAQPPLAPTAPAPTVTPIPQAEITNPLPGHAYIPGEDAGGPPGSLLPAPTVGGTSPTLVPPGQTPQPTDSEPSAKGPSLFDYGEPLTDAIELFAVNSPLEGQRFVAAVQGIMPQHGIEPLAALVNAYYEGHGGTIGDSGEAYGPWQDWMTYYKGRPWYGAGRNNQHVNFWAWTTDGIEYVARSMAATRAKGEIGPQACYDIAFYYERPKNRVADSLQREDAYRSLQGQAGVYDFLAGQMKGPVGWTGAQTTPAVPPKNPSVGPDAAWKDLMRFFGVSVYEQHDKIKRLTSSIAEAIK